MKTVQDILKYYLDRKPVILFLRNNNSTSMYKLDGTNCLSIDILEREVRYKHVFVLSKAYHIELTV